MTNILSEDEELEIIDTLSRRDSNKAKSLNIKYKIDGCDCTALSHLEREYNKYLIINNKNKPAKNI